MRRKARRKPQIPATGFASNVLWLSIREVTPFALLTMVCISTLTGCLLMPLPQAEMEACLAQGTYMDIRTRKCAVIPPPLLPTAAQIEEIPRKINADIMLLQHCEPMIKARYDQIISQMDSETVNYWRYSHQNETPQEFSAYAEHEQLRTQLRTERLRACRNAALVRPTR